MIETDGGFGPFWTVTRGGSDPIAAPSTYRREGRFAAVPSFAFFALTGANIHLLPIGFIVKF